MYDHSEEARSLNNQVKNQLRGINEDFLAKWWTQYNYTKRFFWSQGQQVGCMLEIFENHCGVSGSLETKIILPPAERLGKVLLLPIGSRVNEKKPQASEQVVEKEIVCCLQISVWHPAAKLIICCRPCCRHVDR